MQRAKTPTFHLIGSKFNQVNLLLNPNQYTKYQGSASIFFEVLLTRSKCLELQMAITVNFSWNSLKNKSGNLHIIPNQHIIFQDPSLSAFRDILLTRSKCAEPQKAVTLSRDSLKIQTGNLHIIPTHYIEFQEPSLNTFRDILLTKFNSVFFFFKGA